MAALDPAFGDLATRLTGELPLTDDETVAFLADFGIALHRVAPITDSGFRVLEHDEPGGKMACVLVADADDGRGQAVSWLPHNPARLRILDPTRLPYIGDRHVRSREMLLRPVLLVANIESWLSRRGDALLVTCWQRFAPALTLASIPKVIADSSELATRLEKACAPRFTIVTREAAPVAEAA